MRKMLWGLLLLLLSYLLFFPARALTDARAGLLLWYHSVLPVLFPFMLLCGLLIRFGLLDRALPALSRPVCLLFGCSPYGAFAILCGFLCGFPMGAKLTCDLRRQGRISEQEAYFLYGFVNNLSPSFILSFLAADQMQRPSWGVLFLFNILGSALLCGIIRGWKLRRSGLLRTDNHRAHPSASGKPRKAARDPESMGAGGQRSSIPLQAAAEDVPNGQRIPADVQDAFRRIDDCIYDTIQNAVRLGAYIVMFSLISGAVSLLLPQEHPAPLVLTACIEVSNGVHLIAGSALPLHLRYVLVSALAAFGGFSALAQTVSIASMDRGLLRHYIKSRVKITLLSTLFALTSVLFCRLFFLR